jgi:integrase
MSKRLTKAMLEKLATPKAGQPEIADSVAPGLFLRLGSSGAQTYVLRGRVKGQKSPIRITIGDARQMDLKEARTKAGDLRDKMLAGKDPRDEERAEWSLVVADFIEKHAKRRGNRTWAQTHAILDKKVTPAWGGKLLGDITAHDVASLLNRIEDEGSVYQVNRTLAAVRKLFSWAMTRGLVKTSPVPPGLARTGEMQRDRVLAFDEIAAVWRAAERLGPPFGPMVKLLILTGQRRGETAAARWSGMDLDKDHVWRLTAGETKGKRDHPVPLASAALELVKAQPLIADADAVADGVREKREPPPAIYVFTTTGKTALSGFSKAKADLDAKLKEAGVKLEAWRLHDLRRTVATHMEGALGIPFYIVGAVLNHAPGGYKGVTSRYTQDDLLFERRQALTAWARLLALIVAAGKTWEKVEAILKPKSEADRAQLAEFRRFIQGDEAAWVRYVEALTRETSSSNVADLTRARGAG